MVETGHTALVDVALLLATLLVVLAVIFSFLRLIRGPALADRVVALDLISILSVAFIGVFTIVTQNHVFLDVAIALALISFLATVAFARYCERRAAQGASHDDIDD